MLEQKNQKFQVVTILLIFLLTVMIQLFLISILIIFVRKIRNLLQSQAKPYYYVILFYILTKLAVTTLMQFKIISGIPDQWENLTADFIEICFKNSLIIGDLFLVQLFLISFEHYITICFGFLEMRKIGKIFRLVFKCFQIFIFVLYFTLTLLFNLEIIGYDVNNTVGASLNCLSIVIFLISFFYLNFKMTGILIETNLNESMKKIYKVMSVLLVSRSLMAAFQIVIAINISDGSFEGFIETIIQKQDQYVIFGLLFIGFILFTLLTQGVPMMMSLRTSVVLAFNVHFEKQFESKESIITTNSSVLNDPLIDSSSQIGNQQASQQVGQIIQLKSFKIIEDIKTQGVEKVMKAKIKERTYILRQIKADISNYIIEDLENQIKQIQTYQIRPLNRISFFCQNAAIYMFQRFRPLKLDSMIQKSLTIQEQIKLSLKIAIAIEAFHKKQTPHGCLNNNNIAFDSNENVYFLGYGLESLKKYLSLTTDYTNKTVYTAVQILNDRHKVILRPKKAADIYSFGIILYEIMTKNMNYRTLDLKQVKQKFCSQNFRPKIPEQIEGNIKNLMRKCWQQDPMQRPNISYIVDVLKRLIK